MLCYSLLLLYKVHLGLDSYSGYQAHKIDITLCCCNQRYQLDCSTGCQIFHSSCKCWEVIFPIQTRVFFAYQMYIIVTSSLFWNERYLCLQSKYVHEIDKSARTHKSSKHKHKHLMENIVLFLFYHKLLIYFAI